MRNRILSIFLITALGGVDIASAQPDQKPTDSRTASPALRDDVEVTVTAGKGRLAIAVLQISPELRTHFGAPTDRGVLVDAVRPDGPAAHAGLRVGDVITEVNGKPAKSAIDILDALSDRKKGDEVPVVVLRGGQRVELRPKLDTDPGPRWRAHGGHRFENFPNDFEPWFPDEGESKQLHDAIEQLQHRMDKLERELEQAPAQGGTHRT